MIVDRLSNWRRYTGLEELRPAFEWLDRHAGETLPEGRLDIDGDRLFALPQSYAPKPVEGARFESHRRYADVQYIAGGAEMIGYAPTDTLELEAPYDPEKDIAFFAQPARYTPIALPAGCFAVFYPEDAHMPCCRLDADATLRSTSEPVRKIVLKVKLPTEAA